MCWATAVSCARSIVHDPGNASWHGKEQKTKPADDVLKLQSLVDSLEQAPSPRIAGGDLEASPILDSLANSGCVGYMFWDEKSLSSPWPGLVGMVSEHHAAFHSSGHRYSDRGTLKQPFRPTSN